MEYQHRVSIFTHQSMLGAVPSSFQDAFAQFFKVFNTHNESSALSIFTASFISLALAATFSLYFFAKKSRPPLPPGDLGLPFIGDTFKYFAAYQNFEHLKWIKQKRDKYGPIFKSALLGTTHVFLDAPDGFKLVINPPDGETVGLAIPKSMAALFGQDFMRLTQSTEHPRAMRKYWIENFLGLDVVHRYLPSIERGVLDHIQKFWLSKDDGAEVKSSEVLQFLPFYVIGDLILGIKEQSILDKLLPLFLTYSDGMLCMPVNLPGFQFHRSKKARGAIHDILQQRITQRRQELREGKNISDFLSVFLTRPNEHGHFHTDAEIRENLSVLMWAGFDTIASTTCMMLRVIGKNPEVYKELIKEHANIAANKAEGDQLTVQDLRSMKYSWAVAQESMRLTPPNPDIHRLVMKDIEYKGFTIPKGSKVTCSAAQGMWNPDLYLNPEKFDPTRFIQSAGTKPIPPYTYLPFGAGSRMCAGVEFAKLSMLTFLHHFLKNIQWSLVNPEEKLLYNLLVYPEKGLLLKIQKSKLY